MPVVIEAITVNADTRFSNIQQNWDTNSCDINVNWPFELKIQSPYNGALAFTCEIGSPCALDPSTYYVDECDLGTQLQIYISIDSINPTFNQGAPTFIDGFYDNPADSLAFMWIALPSLF